MEETLSERAEAVDAKSSLARYNYKLNCNYSLVKKDISRIEEYNEESLAKSGKQDQVKDYLKSARGCLAKIE